MKKLFQDYLSSLRKTPFVTIIFTVMAVLSILASIGIVETIDIDPKPAPFECDRNHEIGYWLKEELESTRVEMRYVYSATYNLYQWQPVTINTYQTVREPMSTDDYKQWCIAQ